MPLQVVEIWGHLLHNTGMAFTFTIPYKYIISFSKFGLILALDISTAFYF